MKEKVVNVLGTPYAILFKKKSEEPIFEEADGYCDKTTKEIVIIEQDDDPDPRQVSNFDAYQKQVIRHEIVHAFHMESGLQAHFDVRDEGFPEVVVDWFAIQGPKIYEAWKEADAL
jgi:hypothetical protein